MGLDNGSTVFSFDETNLYNDPANASSACSTTANGFTQYICPLTGTTFTSSTADSLATLGVHPRQNAAFLIARAELNTLNRIVRSSSYQPNSLQSPNLTMSGSVSATSGKVTGTKPTGSVISQPAGTGATITTTAANPGPWVLSMAPDSGGAADLLQAYFSAWTPTVKAPAWKLFFKIKINTVGALAKVDPYAIATMTDATTRAWQFHDDLPMNSPSVLPVSYTAGQTLTFISPSFSVPAGKTLSTFTPAISMQTLGTGTINVSIIAEGVIPDYGATQTHATAFPGAPTSCGGGTPATQYGATDLGGTFTTGTTATTCTITFGLAYQSTAPNCTVTDNTLGADLLTTTVSTTTIALTMTANSGDKVSYVCNGGV